MININTLLLDSDDFAIILDNFNKTRTPPQSLEDIQKLQFDQDKLSTRLMMNSIGDKHFVQKLADGVSLLHKDISENSFKNLIIKENPRIRNLFKK